MCLFRSIYWCVSANVQPVGCQLCSSTAYWPIHRQCNIWALLLLVLWCRFAVSCPLEASLTTEMGISNQSNSAASFVQIRWQLSFGRVLFREEQFFMSMRKRRDHRPVLLRSEGYPGLFGLNPVFFPGQVTMVSYAKWITCSEACSVYMIELSFLEYRILS